MVSALFRLALIDKFLHSWPLLDLVRRAIGKIGFFGAVSVGVIDSHHLLIRPSLRRIIYDCVDRDLDCRTSPYPGG